MLQLRPYQLAAQNAVYEHLRTRDDNPCVCLPTGSGKSPLMAAICKDAVELWHGRVLILAHVKELLEQTADKLQQVCPEVSFGIYCAGLNRRETQEPVIIASIQSIWKKAAKFEPFDLILIDEGHSIGTEEDGMYVSFLADMKRKNPLVRVIGFTATPYRLKTGPLCTPEGVLNHICYEVGLCELIRNKYLCPLISKAGKTKVDTSKLHVRDGDFIPSEVEMLMNEVRIVEAACEEIVELSRERQAVLLFASGIAHGNQIVRVLREKHNLECGFVIGDTPSKERARTLARFKAGDLKYLCNINVLTTGFDATQIDTIALLRPTLSPGLLSQSVGRGLRLHPNKQNCLILDFAGNIMRLGPVDQLNVKKVESFPGEAPVKECPECHTLVAAGCYVCPECAYEFPDRPVVKHAAKASEIGVLSDQHTITKWNVQDVCYRIHVKHIAHQNTPPSMRVDYQVAWRVFKSEWICFEHQGYPRQQAVSWWKKRSRQPVPDSVAEAVEIARAGGLAPTNSITVRTIPGEYFERIIAYQLGAIPETLLPAPASYSGSLDFPFGANLTTPEEHSW